MDNQFREIKEAIRRLESRRQVIIREATNQFDREEFNPSMKILMGKCAALGHGQKIAFTENGLGWSWFYCHICGSRLDIKGPPDNTEITHI